jgi:hypothetical protein
MAQTSLLLTHSSSSSPTGGGGGGCPCFSGMVTKNKEQHHWLLVSKTKRETEGGSTHSLKHLTMLLRVFYLHCRCQLMAM